MNPWNALAATPESARLHTSDHWEPVQIDRYLDLIDGALEPCEPAGTIMDLGSGIGRLTLPYAHRHPLRHVIGVDTSDDMCRHARYRHERDDDNAAVEFFGSIDAADVGLFDGGWSVLMFQHVPNETMLDYLLQLTDHLKPGGRFLFQFVLDAEPGPLSYPRPTFVAADMVYRAGLTRVETRSGLIEPEWCWMTVEKPA